MFYKMENDILQNFGFSFIICDEMKELLSLRKDLLPIMKIYGGMGYYHVFIENENLNSKKRFAILTLGGSNDYDRKNTTDLYIKYKGPYHDIESCIKFCEKNLMEY
jgi:hypothetical protein